MRVKIISSLEKCFPDQSVPEKPALEQAVMLQNERFSFQVCYDLAETVNDKKIVYFQVESPLAEHIRIYKVRCIPSLLPVYRQHYDANYLRTQPGLFPDLLEPMQKGDRLPASNVLNALWVEVDLDGSVPAGEYPLRCVFTDTAGETAAAVELPLRILSAALPEQRLTFTQWFYTDCLMNYYGTEAFDERHWQIIENFMANAARYGMNMILTPVLTPPLDTHIGGERPTTQLVDITLTGGVYSFDFSKLGRWVDLCRKTGIRYLEINHFFTQWGAAACPKVVATVDGVKKRIFGWDTPSDSDGYRAFLYALIPQLLDYLKSKDAHRCCYFHISDEPHKEHLAQYQKVSSMIRPLLEGYPILDALSDFDFYAASATTCPVPACNHMDRFLDKGIPSLWTYYCCDQAEEVSNRFFAMPSARTRILGVQLYKYRIAGFLHWGYNYYYNQDSYVPINPFLCSDGEGFAPSGDTYSVYPGTGGQPWPSLRQAVFYDALQDLRALELCEARHGREYTMQLLEEGIEPITFHCYPQDDEFLPNLRSRLYAAIEAE